MLKVILLLLCMMEITQGQEPNAQKIEKLAQKGARIVKVLCDKKKLPQMQSSFHALTESIIASKACSPLSKSKLEAVAYYIQQGKHSHTKTQHIHVSAEDKCPVCGMFVSKYPKWVAMMKVSGKTYYFDGVKDMMKYYIFDGDFVYDRKAISQLLVSDYYTLKAIFAKEAFYVLDSDVYGPMGHELIPFESHAKAKAFSSEHHGKAIFKFDKITDTMVMALDGIIQ